MLVLQFNVRNQRLSRFNSATVASDAYGYLKCQFNFITNDWQKASVKWANFSHKGRNYPILIDNDNMCLVPKEVIKCPVFSVSVYGGGITTNIVRIPVEPSCTMPDDDNMKYYNDIINKLSATIDDMNESKADNIIHNEEEGYIQLSANGVPVGDQIELTMSDCGIKSFDVDENDNITITLTDGRIINLGHIEGASRVTFVPHIDEKGILTWTNNGGLDNPPAFDLNCRDEWFEDTDDHTSDDYFWEDE